MPQPKLSAAQRATLADRGLELYAYQPSAMFRGSRKLSLVAEPTDPWSVTLYHKRLHRWADNAAAGHAIADTLEEALGQALAGVTGGGGLLGAMSRLAGALEDLAGVIHAQG